MRSFLHLLVFCALAGLGGPESEAQESDLTPNAFFGRGDLTFVYGTAGDDASDLRTKTQAAMVRQMFFPKADLVPDTEIDVTRGLAGWPKNPILYGGPHVNRALAALGDRLPLSMKRGQTEFGGWTFNGDEYRIITVVPGSGVGKQAYPSFLLYAGNGAPGVGEINGTRHGGSAILVGDRFGPLIAGGWGRDDAGRVVARMGKKARRIEWRTTTLTDDGKPKVTLTLQRAKQLPPLKNEKAENEACLRGVRRACTRLGVESAVKLEIHFYPDRGSKQSLTGRPGDGHADVLSRSLHVLSLGPGREALLEQLLAHEATHIVGYDAWAPAGTALFGEGLAVWAADEYAGRKLEIWRRTLPADPPSVAALLGRGFRQIPEQQAYPTAGLLTGRVIEEVGAEAFRKHLLPATSANWVEACKAAGTTAAKIEAMLRVAATPAKPR